MDFRSIGGKALAVVAKVGWPAVVVAAIVFGGELRGCAKVLKHRWDYGARGIAPADGSGVLTKPTPDVKGQPVDVIPAVPLPPAVAARLRRPTATLSAGTRFATEQAAEPAERRTGADLTGDGTVAGRTAESVAEDRTERGGRQGRELEERHPAAETQIHLASGVVPPTGDERGGKVDAIQSPASGQTSIIFTLDPATRWGFPHEFEAAARIGLDSARSYAPTTDAWEVDVRYTPVRYRWARLGLRARYGQRQVESLGQAVEVRGESYWLEVYVRCRSLLRGECGP